MKAVLLKQPKNFVLTDIDEAAEPGAHEATVRVHNVGICGSDISGYLGKMPFYSYPRIPGHELGVEVVAVGKDVENVVVGDKCSVEPYINNPNSYASQQGCPNCCNDLEVLGVHRDGGLRPRFNVLARKLHASSSLTTEQLALVETLGIGCHAVERADPKPHDIVLTIGAGPIGLSVLEFVRLRGARSIVMDLNQHRLDFCKRNMGVDDTIVFSGDGSNALAEFTEITNGNLAKVVFDATGNNVSMSNAYNFVGYTGKLVWVGLTTTPLTFTQKQMHAREMTFLASRNALPEDFRKIITHIEQGEIDTRPWITHRSKMAELIDVFPNYVNPESGVIKAMVAVEDS